MGAFEKIFGTHSERELKRIKPLVDKIEALRPTMMEMSDEQLREKTSEFKKRLESGETLDDILVEAFAVVREASRRVLGMEPYRVQLIGAPASGRSRPHSPCAPSPDTPLRAEGPSLSPLPESTGTWRCRRYRTSCPPHASYPPPDTTGQAPHPAPVSGFRPVPGTAAKSPDTPGDPWGK